MNNAVDLFDVGGGVNLDARIYPIGDDGK